MTKQILVIIRRSNGDVLLASPLIQHLQAHYPEADIDLLVNDDTLGIAKALRPIRQIHVYSYQWKKLARWERLRKVWGLMRSLWRRYDLAISLTTTDSSVLYAWLFGRYSISAIDAEGHKNWWKKRLLSGYYGLNTQQHVIQNNLEPLHLLGIPLGKLAVAAHYTAQAKAAVLDKLKERNIAPSFFVARTRTL